MADAPPQLDELAKRVAKLEAKPKDWWDIASICVIPLTIALSGFFVSKALKDAELASARSMADAHIASTERIATQQAQLEQSKLVALYMDALMSADTVKRLLAVEALSLVSPDNGRRFMEIVSRRDPSPQVRQAASSALSTRLLDLVNQAFSLDEPARRSAVEQLASRWRSEATLISLLLDRAEGNLGHEDAIYNTVLLLQYVDRRHLLAHRGRVEAFLARLELLRDRPETLKRVRLVRERFQRADAGR